MLPSKLNTGAQSAASSPGRRASSAWKNLAAAAATWTRSGEAFASGAGGAASGAAGGTDLRGAAGAGAEGGVAGPASASPDAGPGGGIAVGVCAGTAGERRVRGVPAGTGAAGDGFVSGAGAAEGTSREGSAAGATGEGANWAGGRWAAGGGCAVAGGGASVGSAGAGAAWASGDWTSASARSAASPFMARGAYASFQCMASEPRQVWGDLATSAFVQGSHLFRILGEEETRDLLKLAVAQDFVPGERILEEGGAVDEFFLVRGGIAVVSASRNGQAVELGLLEKGAFFGEFRLISGVPHVATVTARTQMTVVRFPSSMIAALAGRHPKVQKLLEAVKAGREKENQARLSP